MQAKAPKTSSVTLPAVSIPATSVVAVSSQAENVTLLASSAQANSLPSSIGTIYPSGHSVAPAPQYPLLQSSTRQPTVIHVYSGHLSSFYHNSQSVMLCQLRVMVVKQMI